MGILDRLEAEVGELLSRGGSGDLQAFARYADDPVGFIRDVLRADPWERQVEIAEAVRDHRNVTVRSCHAAGKDWIAGRLALWWAYAVGGVAVLTGPTEQQVTEILMRHEVREAFDRVRPPGDLGVKALRLPNGESRILAKTATGVGGLTGIHRARVLFICTEAQDPSLDHAWQAAFTVATGEADRKLMVGNPVEKAGRFYESHRSSNWHAVKIAASDIPNVREGRTVVPGLLTIQGVEDIAAEYGEDSSFYVGRVLAEFPDSAVDALIPRSWIDDAVARWARSRARGETPEGPLVAGLDPSRWGRDSSVLAIRRDAVLAELLVWPGGRSTADLLHMVEAALSERGFRRRIAGELGAGSGGRPVRVGSQSRRGRIVVDEPGLGGPVLDQLAERRWRAEGFNGGSRATDPSRYFNRRAEAWHTFARLLEEDRLALPPDRALQEELAAVRYSYTAQDLLQLESKVDLKARLGRSPDRADAAVLAFAPQLPSKRPSTRVNVHSFG
jgi:hypothetical protein